MLIASVLLSFLNTETAHKAAIWLTRSENYTRKQTIQDQILPKVDQKWVNWFLTYNQMALNWFCCFCFSKRCMESFSLIRLLNDGGLSECKSLGHWRSKSNSSVQQRRCQKWQRESECSFYQGKYCRFQVIKVTLNKLKSKTKTVVFFVFFKITQSKVYASAALN